MPKITVEQVEQLSPDAASTKRARGLAYPSHWTSLGASDAALWGECKGSGKKPYRTQVDLTDFASKCSCPSRKFPCKHALGLLLIAAQAPAALKEKTPPEWAAAWLEKRRKRAEKKQAQAEAKTDDAALEKAAQRRAEKRDALAQEGVDALERWLKDTVHLGLAALETMPRSFWRDQAARMVDCQIPGAGRFIEEMQALPGSSPDWPQRMLFRLGRLFLLARAYRQIETLSEETQADVRTFLGWNTNQEDVIAASPAVQDDWSVLAAYTEDFERAGLKAFYNWLWGQQTGRLALLLTFARQHVSLIRGCVYRGALHFYPGAAPMRAVFAQKKRLDGVGRVTPAGDSDLESFLGRYAAALGRNPWLASFPAVLTDVIPRRVGDDWLLQDGTGAALPLTPHFQGRWPLLALSGGPPLTVFVLWDGYFLTPITVWADGRSMQL